MSNTKGIMSSKVLNMKFMKQAEVKQEEKEVEEKQTKLKDSSEWKTTLPASLQRKIQKRQRVVKVGYSSINSLDKNIVGRRVFGEKKEDEKSKQNDETKALGELWNQSKNTAKRNNDDKNIKSSKKRKPEL